MWLWKLPVAMLHEKGGMTLVKIILASTGLKRDLFSLGCNNFMYVAQTEIPWYDFLR